MPVNRPHILVVDDVTDQADSMADLLEVWGYDAAARYDGAAALAAVRGRRPAVVLLDIGMPGMDGFEFVTLFRDLPGCGTTPLVAVTGYETLTAQTWASGIDHYLVKPVDPGVLRALLLRLVGTAPTRSAAPARCPVEPRHDELCVTG